ncbi:hypothetical protein Hanom_Chr09g00760871 [Helianthus anomalus]
MCTIFCKIATIVNITFFIWDGSGWCIFSLHIKEFLKNIQCINQYLFWDSMIYHLFKI